MTTTNGSDHADPQITDEFMKLSARLGVVDELIPVQIVLKVVGGAHGHLNHRFEKLQGELEALAKRVAELEARDP